MAQKKYRKAKVSGQVRGILLTAKHRGWVKTLSKMQGGCCYWCEEALDGDATLDHYIPLAKGGEDVIDNSVASHWLCNNRKDDMMPDEYLASICKPLEGNERTLRRGKPRCTHNQGADDSEQEQSSDSCQSS